MPRDCVSSVRCRKAEAAVTSSSTAVKVKSRLGSPGEASKKSDFPGEPSMRAPLTGSFSSELSSRSAGSSSGAVPCDQLAWLLDA